MSYFKRIISLLLVDFFLLGNSGIHIYRSFCNLTGESSLEIFANQESCDHHKEIAKQEVHQSCCHKNAQKDVKKTKCCDEEQIDLKVNLPYAVQKSNFLFQTPLALISKKADFVPTSIAQLSRSNHHLKCYPPPLSGKERLFMIASLRI